MFGASYSVWYTKQKVNILRPLHWYGYRRITGRATGVLWLEPQACYGHIFQNYGFGHKYHVANNTTAAITTTATGLLRVQGLRSV